MKPTFVLCLLIGAASLLHAQDNEGTKKCWYKRGQYDSLVISNMSVNSKWDDYAPIMLKDNKLYFTSDRRNKEGDKAALAYNEKIYVTQAKDTNWVKPRAFYFFNSDDQSALAGVSYGSGKLFIYKTFGNGDLFFSVKEKGKWSKPKRLKNPINTDAHEQSAAEENNVMIISSDRGAEDGTHNLFQAKPNAQGNYVDFKPITALNTDGDEVDVRLSRDGNKLYFASNGLNGIGGYDVYYSELDENGEWQKPVAFSLPINSKGDDRYFFDCDSAFFLTSDREGGKGADDLFWGHLVTHLPKPVDTVRGKDSIVVVMDTNRFSIMERKLDSAGIKKYYARVQIGAYYNRTVPQFKRYYPGLKDRDIYIEQVVWYNGRLLNKFIIDQVFKTIKDASVVQQEMWTVHKITDTFVAIYDFDTNERVAIYNTIIGKFVILKGDQKPFYF
jgi:hypothetical protein